MNSFHSPVRALSTNGTDTPDVDPKVKDERRQSDVDSDSSTSDDEGSESSPHGSTSPNGMGTGVWSKEEHAQFLEAIKIYANGPWKLVAAFVGTRTVRQTMTHAQKYRQKAARRLRGLRTKQALMRMHFGHHVSEESLMQERLRAMGAAHDNNYHLTGDSIGLSLPGEHPRDISPPGAEILPCKRFVNESEVAAWVSPLSTDEPEYLDATMIDVEDVDLLEDLTASPTLEECATELLNLLF